MIYYLGRWYADQCWFWNDFWKRKRCYFLHSHLWKKEWRKGHYEHKMVCPKCLETWMMT